jgi:ribonuclease R
MRDRIGEELDGVITGVTNFGIFVEAVDPFVEGMIKLASLGDDAFDLDEKTMRLRGRRSGATFALGDKLRDRIENVSVPRRRIDFALIRDDSVEGLAAAEAAPERARRKGKGRKKGARS